MPNSGSSVKLRNDKTGTEQLGLMLAQCYEALNVYGKTPEQASGALRLFSMVLADYTIEQITTAFTQYLHNHRDMPTPSDIVGYIRREGRPPLDRSIYISLCKKRELTAWREGSEVWQRGDGLTDAETKYIADYEKYEGL